MEMLIFAVAAIVALASAVMVIAVKNPVGGVLFLIMSIAAQTVLYIMLSGIFVAAFMILVYAGAIMVLFLFVIMMLNLRHADLGPDSLRRVKPLAWVFGSVLLAELVWVSMAASMPASGIDETFGSVPAVSRLLYGKFVYPFELTSVLLLAAIIGAVVMARKGS
ncbi:MAG: NADH-quinone oxidoreductase subunit J [candidate division Zixibacteria bacterium]|nr:NADH-quinone oxidoreductase subunit J [candidate division Zixibacteria bacterium]